MKVIAECLVDPGRLPSVDETQQRVAGEIARRLSTYIAEAKRIKHRNMELLIAKRAALKVRHQAERQAFDSSIAACWN